MTETPPSQTTYVQRPGSFGHVLGLMVPAFTLCWKNARTIIGISLLLGITSVGWSLVSAAIAPDHSIQGWIGEFDVTSELESEEGSDDPFARFNDMSDEEIDAYFNDMSEEDLNAFIEQAEREEMEMQELPETEWEAFMQGFAEGFSESQELQGGPIYQSLDFAGQMALVFFAWIAAYYIMGQSVRENRTVSVSEAIEAVRTCPGRFYIAVIKKWVYLFAVFVLPILAFAGILAWLGSLGDEMGDGMVVIFPVIGIIASFIYGIYLSMKWLLIEPIVLFDGERFNGARLESGRLMKGSKRSFFFGYMLIAMVFMVAMMLFGIVFGVVGGIAMVMMALFSEILAIIGVILFMLPFILLQFIGAFYFIGLIMLVWDALSKHKGTTSI